MSLRLARGASPTNWGILAAAMPKLQLINFALAHQYQLIGFASRKGAAKVSPGQDTTLGKSRTRQVKT